MNILFARLDISETFIERADGMVKEHKELISTGIVRRDCFEALVSHNSKFDTEEVWHFLIAFHLATEIKQPRSLYIPALIPDFMEARINARLADAKKDKSTLGFYYCFDKCDKVFGLFNKLLGGISFQQTHLQGGATWNSSLNGLLSQD